MGNEPRTGAAQSGWLRFREGRAIRRPQRLSRQSTVWLTTLEHSCKDRCSGEGHDAPGRHYVSIPRALDRSCSGRGDPARRSSWYGIRTTGGRGRGSTGLSFARSSTGWHGCVHCNRGTIQGLDQALTGDAETIRRLAGVKLLDRPSSNVGYVGINQSIPPMDKVLVRQAVAYGLGSACLERRVRLPLEPLQLAGHAG
jgi:hypothetical protein